MKVHAATFQLHVSWTVHVSLEKPGVGTPQQWWHMTNRHGCNIRQLDAPASATPSGPLSMHRRYRTLTNSFHATPIGRQLPVIDGFQAPPKSHHLVDRQRSRALILFSAFTQAGEASERNLAMVALVKHCLADIRGHYKDSFNHRWLLLLLLVFWIAALRTVDDVALFDLAPTRTFYLGGAEY